MKLLLISLRVSMNMPLFLLLRNPFCYKKFDPHRVLASVKFPVQPPLETVGEFKVTPMIHAGYAFTWFGLASAGVVMTRKLITKGR